MNAAHNPLSQLADIHIPTHINWWPPAPGWWLSFFIVIVGILITYFIINRYQKKWGYRNVALKLLQQQWKQHNPESSLRTCQDFLTTLKRCVITAYPSEFTNGLHGEQWKNYLNDKTKKPYFGEKPSKLLTENQYKKNSAINEELVEALYDACKLWIKKHEINKNHKEVGNV